MRENNTMQEPLEEHVLATYFTLRVGIAVIAIAFPLLLWLGGRFYVGLPLQDSMSAYYHAAVDGRSMRNWFVGILFAVGVFLYLYKGFSNKENYALNVAGVMAIGVAVFPMEWACGEACSRYSVHGVCAVLFFVSIAFVSVRCAADTLSLIQDEHLRTVFRRAYKTLAGLMLASPAIALVLNFILLQHRAAVFYVEAFGILAFAAYWLTKSRELALSQAEKKALRGELRSLEPPSSK
jgi:hypothetical protein